MRRKVKLLPAGIVAIGLLLAFAMIAVRSEEGTTPLKTHLTLYVGGELLRDGGTVVVSSIAVPESELRAMTGTNPAVADNHNAKAKQLNEEDILFGAFVTGRANFVEMYYPAGGTFGFNFVADSSEVATKSLVTERILIGSSGWSDPENPDKWIDADVSTIFVDGPKASKSESRVVRVIESRLELSPDNIFEYQGVRVKIPTARQLIEASSGEIK